MPFMIINCLLPSYGLSRLLAGPGAMSIRSQRSFFWQPESLVKRYGKQIQHHLSQLASLDILPEAAIMQELQEFFD